MDTLRIKAAAAAVTGARHLRSSRNGQDAAVVWTGSAAAPPNTACRAGSDRGDDDTQASDAAGLALQLDGRSTGARWNVRGGDDADRMCLAQSDPHGQVRPSAPVRDVRGRDDLAVVVVCDGCSSGGSSEVGARLGATLFARALGARLGAGERVNSAATWSAVRSDVVRALVDLVERMPGDRAHAIHDHFLFTIVAAAVTRDGAAVWALGDGAYSFGESTRVLGPFADNAPPYLAYDLLGDVRPAHFEVAPASCRAIVIATDGATELEDGIEGFAASTFVDHPDALRRRLAVLARTNERIDWDERRVVRTPAVLQDDCAIGVLRWSVA